MKLRLIAIGAVIWFAATVALRLGGQHLIPDHHWWRIVPLFGISFLLMAAVLRVVCSPKRRLDEQLLNALALLLPTLLLDPFSSAFFTRVFPNMPADNAGVFGGWMLISCAGGLLGVAFPRRAGDESTRSA